MWNTPTKKQLEKLPPLYSTEGNSVNNIKIHMHFFLGGSDWFIAEYDPKSRLFFCYALLNCDLDNAEWGYTSYAELLALRQQFVEVDRDIHWKPKTFKEVMRGYVKRFVVR